MVNFIHKPVMLKEVKELFTPLKGNVLVDGTCGLGGHTMVLAEIASKIIAIDKDIKALEKARKNLSDSNIIFEQENFSEIDKVLNKLKIKKVSGVLLDLGVSSMQLDDSSRGFSFMKDAPLDMRMDQTSELTAEKIVNQYSESELNRIFWEFGQEKFSRRIAENIVNERIKRPIKTTLELVKIIKNSLPEGYIKRQKIPLGLARGKHFATNIFRSLRMEVNNEIGSLIDFFNKAQDLISDQGRIVVISFHSIEDRVTKRAFREYKNNRLGKILTPKPVTPQKEELLSNPRSRSAKLRGFEFNF